MEPDVRLFLLTILNTISVGMVWLLVNMTIGIYYGFAFFDDKPTLGNYIYGVFFITSLVLFIRYLKKKWRGWKEIGE